MKKLEPRVTNNTVESKGPCDPDCLLSPGSKGQMRHHQESILAANVTARLQEKECHQDGYPSASDSWRVRGRYRSRMVNAGMATYHKSPDKIY